jgi:NADH-quinone oxidoreductase subunit C
MSDNSLIPGAPKDTAPATSLPPPASEPNRAGQAAASAPAPAAVLLEAKPHALSHLSLPFHEVDFATRGIHLEASVSPQSVVIAAEELDEMGFGLDTITGVDWLAQNEIEVVYDYFHPTRPLRVAVRVRVPRENAELPTISEVFPGANWHERETHDFFGVRFVGHPDLSPFLLPEDADYHPLRKDFTA